MSSVNATPVLVEQQTESAGVWLSTLPPSSSTDNETGFPAEIPGELDAKSVQTAVAAAGDGGGADAFDYLIVAFAVGGVGINVSSLFILCWRKRFCSMFHKLLMVLSISDLVVVIGCPLLYALPDLWPSYRDGPYSLLLPWTLPITQIAMMTSVYATIVLSLERYVRINITCRLRSSTYITEENFKYYVIGIVLCPVIFYLPKFFELTATDVYGSILVKPDCANVLERENATNFQELFGFSLSPAMVSNSTSVRGSAPRGQLDFAEEDAAVTAAVLAKCAAVWAEFERAGMGMDEMAALLPFLDEYNELFEYKIFLKHDIASTRLGSNVLYKRLYASILNTIIAYVIPIFSLIFFNFFTVLALHKMGRENNLAVSSRVSNSAMARSNSTHNTNNLYNNNNHIHGNSRSLGGGGGGENKSVRNRVTSRIIEMRFTKRTKSTRAESKSSRRIRMKYVLEKKETLPLTPVLKEVASEGALMVEGNVRRGRILQPPTQQQQQQQQHSSSRRAQFFLGGGGKPSKASNEVSSESGVGVRKGAARVRSLSSSRSASNCCAHRRRSESQSDYSPTQRNAERNCCNGHAALALDTERDEANDEEGRAAAFDRRGSAARAAARANGRRLKSRAIKSGRRRNMLMGGCDSDAFRRRANSAPSEIVSEGTSTSASTSSPSASSCAGSSSHEDNNNKAEEIRNNNSNMNDVGLASASAAKRRPPALAPPPKPRRGLILQPKLPPLRGAADRHSKWGRINRYRPGAKKGSSTMLGRILQRCSPGAGSGSDSAASLPAHGAFGGCGGDPRKCSKPCQRQASLALAVAQTRREQMRYNINNNQQQHSNSLGRRQQRQPPPHVRVHLRRPTASQPPSSANGAAEGGWTPPPMPSPPPPMPLPPRSPTSATVGLRRGERRLTRIALAIVCLYIFCHIWKIIPTAYEAIHSWGSSAGDVAWPDWLNSINDVSHLLIVVNSAVNFLLYTVL